ncbi:hypothetical protein SKM57_12290 [Acinetobacter faecalis]|uniref:hypothetical protein n=1 Tax=Acinetobacter faecalis TaxID=2665161 RepID=UPI002A909C8E|nr:hypothetical protein [Acinetobacter faecalis]MDY6458070.1 hypothetical protein [Acinetobacter faecalis]MDY6469357.1 hypothetical protein [Acinetobacter faecalis]
MIKKREVLKSQSSDMDSFINGANEKVTPKLDPKAPRKFKTHTIPMNEYEYQLLVELSEQHGQTHNGLIRFALKKLSDEQHLN